jgi:hypothetical protein
MELAMATVHDVEGISDRIPIRPLEPVVYFLISGDEVVYVGQTCNLLTRIGNHQSTYAGKFDSFAFLPVARENLLAEEKKWIILLNPRLNGPPAPHYKRAYKPYWRQPDVSIVRSEKDVDRLALQLGCDSPEQLASFSVSDLLEKRGFGEKSLENLTTYLGKRGLSLRGEKCTTHSN